MQSTETSFKSSIAHWHMTKNGPYSMTTVSVALESHTCDSIQSSAFPYSLFLSLLTAFFLIYRRGNRGSESSGIALRTIRAWDGKMVQWLMCLLRGSQPESDLWGLHGGRREQTLTSCPLISTHLCTYIHIQRINKCNTNSACPGSGGGAATEPKGSGC